MALSSAPKPPLQPPPVDGDISPKNQQTSLYDLPSSRKSLFFSQEPNGVHAGNLCSTPVQQSSSSSGNTAPASPPSTSLPGVVERNDLLMGDKENRDTAAERHLRTAGDGSREELVNPKSPSPSSSLKHQRWPDGSELGVIGSESRRWQRDSSLTSLAVVDSSSCASSHRGHHRHYHKADDGDNSNSAEAAVSSTTDSQAWLASADSEEELKDQHDRTPFLGSSSKPPSADDADRASFATRQRDTDSSSSSSSSIPDPRLSIVLSIAFYCTVSLGIVFLNRQIFTHSFRYPVFVSWLQQVVGFVSFQVLSHLSSKLDCLACLRVLFPEVPLQSSRLLAVLPLSVSFVGMIGFSNTCLKYVQVSTYQVARALTLLFSLIFTRLILKAFISKKSALACLVVMLGFVAGSMDPDTLSVIGIVTGVISSVFQAFYMVQIKRSLTALDNDQNTLLCYNLLLSAIIFFPVIFFAGEQGFVHDLPLSLADPAFCTTWSLLLSSGFLGILLTMATYWCVRVTSPVTFNVVGYAKACLQSLGGIVLLGDIVTAKSLLGILLTLLGSFWYSHAKVGEHRENAACKNASSPTRPGVPGSDVSPRDKSASAVLHGSSGAKQELQEVSDSGTGRDVGGCCSANTTVFGRDPSYSRSLKNEDRKENDNTAEGGGNVVVPIGYKRKD